MHALRPENSKILFEEIEFLFMYRVSIRSKIVRHIYHNEKFIEFKAKILNIIYSEIEIYYYEQK